MLSTVATCLHCGTINQAAEPVCVTCGGDLAVAVNPSFTGPVYEPVPDPDLFPGIQPFSVSNVLSTTLKLFTKHLWLITKIVLVIAAPLEILKATSFANTDGDLQVRTVTTLLGAAANVLIAPALLYALMKVTQTGKSATVQESFSWSLSKIIHFAACALIAYLIQGLGYLLFIIPGIIIGLRFAVVYPVAILENQSIREVFDRSDDLTRGSRWEILGAQIVLLILTTIVTFGLGFLIGGVNFAPLTVIAGVVIDIVEQLPFVMAFVIYLSLLKTDKLLNRSLYAKN